MSFNFPFFVFFSAIIWICFECTNGSGLGDVQMADASSSSNMNTTKHKQANPDEDKQNKKAKTEIRKTKNLWDATACDKLLRITGDECLTVHYKELRQKGGYRTVFAKHSISSNNDSNGIFYFEITIKKMDCCIMFGFGYKRHSLYDKRNCFPPTGIYAYESNGYFHINGERRKAEFDYKFVAGDVVGCGVNTFYSSNFSFASYSAVDQLFPFVSLFDHKDEITANFGSEEFKFKPKSL